MSLLLAAFIICFLNLLAAILAKYLSYCSHNMLLLVLIVGGMIVTYFARMVFWYYAGKRWQLSFLYPFLSVNYLVAIPFGIILFKEHVSINRIIGAVIICMGVLMLSKTEHRVEQG